MERLEGKALLAADLLAGNFTVGQSAGPPAETWININGTGNDDRIFIENVNRDSIQIQIRTAEVQPQSITWVWDIPALEFIAQAAGMTFTGFRVFGNGGKDTIDARQLKFTDRFTLEGGPGDDTIHGGVMGDVIRGGDGNDTIHNADELDDLAAAGGPGTADKLFFAPLRGPISLTSDNVEEVHGTDADDVIDLSSNTGPVTIHGGAGNDVLYGGAADDSLHGDKGDDDIYGNLGDDFLDGGAGEDFLLGDGLNATEGGSDEIHGGADNDYLDGQLGSDSLFGGTGDDDLRGHDGNDTLQGDAGDDKLAGENGNDALRGGADHDSLNGGDGADSLDGGTGTDEASYLDSPMGVSIDLKLSLASQGHASGDGLAGVENLRGSNFADTLIGNDAANAIWGGGSHDWLFGRGGGDQLRGGAGNDILEGDGDGLLSTPAPNGSIGGDAADNLEGGDGHDVLFGGDSTNLLAALMGDILDGGAGDDWLLGGLGVDFMFGKLGSDRLYTNYFQGTGINDLALIGDEGVPPFLSDRFHVTQSDGSALTTNEVVAAHNQLLAHAISDYSPPVDTLDPNPVTSAAAISHHLGAIGQGKAPVWNALDVVADANGLLAPDRRISVNPEERIVAAFDMGGTPNPNPAHRNLSFGLATTGWRTVLQTFFQPAVDAGVSRFLVMTPFGKSSYTIDPDTGEVVPLNVLFQFDAYLDAIEEVPNQNATREFVPGWQEFFARNRDLDAIVYIGSPRHDADQVALIGDPEAWWNRAYDILLPLLEAGFRSIGFDAGARSLPETLDYQLHNVLRHPELRDPVRDARLIDVVGDETIRIYLESTPIDETERTDFPLVLLDWDYQRQQNPGREQFIERDRFTDEIIRIVRHEQWEEKGPDIVEEILMDGHAAAVATRFFLDPSRGGATTMDGFVDLLTLPGMPTLVDLDLSSPSPDPEMVEYEILRRPRFGTLTDNRWHVDVFTYRPNTDFTGIDSFTYYYRDAAGNRFVREVVFSIDVPMNEP